MLPNIELPSRENGKREKRICHCSTWVEPTLMRSFRKECESKGLTMSEALRYLMSASVKKKPIEEEQEPKGW